LGTKYNGTPEEIRALDAFIKFYRAAGSFKTRIDRHHPHCTLSESQFGTLEMLFHLGPLNQKSIGKKLLISKSNVVSVIDKLEQRGLVKRQRCEEDRRNIYIHLTEAGEDLIQDILPIHVATIVKEMSCLSAAEQDELGRLCKKLGRMEI
jgi:MarR family 2-MHQ and catechol resistance regulon transcriptional repressor